MQSSSTRVIRSLQFSRVANKSQTYWLQYRDVFDIMFQFVAPKIDGGCVIVFYSFKIFSSHGKCAEAWRCDGFPFVLSPAEFVKQRSVRYFVLHYDR